MRANRIVALTLIAALLALPLAACGKKSEPQPPPGQPQTYPGQYPSE